MLKKEITYVNFNGEKVTENFYFNITQAEAMEMEANYEGSIKESFKNLSVTRDGAKIIATVKDLILRAYGEKSEDGKRFIKNQEIRDGFVSTEAYSILFMELCTDAKAAVEFMKAILPEVPDKDKIIEESFREFKKEHDIEEKTTDPVN